MHKIILDYENRFVLINEHYEERYSKNQLDMVVAGILGVRP